MAPNLRAVSDSGEIKDVAYAVRTSLGVQQ